jgi:DNA replication protein DnaC
MVGQPRDFFGNRDIDLLHNWGADLLEYDLPANLETFIMTHKQLNKRDQGQDIVRRDMLNDGQRKVYDYVLNNFSNSIETNAPRLENVIVMGKGGVGKSFLIRAMEHGI